MSVKPEWVSSRASSPEAVQRRSEACDCQPVLDLIAKMQPGDELRTFRTPKATWPARAGYRGYVLWRDGAVVAHAVTARS